MSIPAICRGVSGSRETSSWNGFHSTTSANGGSALTPPMTLCSRSSPQRCLAHLHGCRCGLDRGRDSERRVDCERRPGVEATGAVLWHQRRRRAARRAQGGQRRRGYSQLPGIKMETADRRYIRGPWQHDRRCQPGGDRRDLRASGGGPGRGE